MRCNSWLRLRRVTLQTAWRMRSTRFIACHLLWMQEGMELGGELGAETFDIGNFFELGGAQPVDVAEMGHECGAA